MNVTRRPLAPTLKQNHAHLLCVGEPEDPDARAASAVREDAVGTWSLHETTLEALERGLQLLREQPGRRVVLDLGDCLCVDEQQWTGPALSRLERVCASVPRGALAMTRDFREHVSEHIEIAEDLQPLRTPDMSGGASELMIFQAESDDAVFSCSNLSFSRRMLLGRRDTLERLEGLEDQGARVIEITGVGGVGKSELAYQYACTRAVQSASVERWWLDLEGVSRAEGIARGFALLFGTRLGPPEQWHAQTLAMLANRPLACAMHLDGLEQLDAEATAWLHELIAQSSSTRWVLTRREAWGLEGAREVPVGALDEDDGLALLMTDSEGMRGVRELERARALWRGCSGRPLALLHAKRHAHGVAPSTREELSDTSRARRDWDTMSEPYKELLAVLSEFTNGASLELLEVSFEGARGRAALSSQLSELRLSGWAHVDPTRNVQTWRVPEGYSRFLAEHLSEAHRALAREGFRRGVVGFVRHEISHMRGPREGDALTNVRYHEHDLLRAIEATFEVSPADAVALVTSLHLYVRFAFSTFDLHPLLTRIRAQVEDTSDLAAELDLSLALTASYNAALSMASGAQLDRCIERVDALGQASRFDLYYQRATELEDTLKSTEELERALELLDLADAQIEDEQGWAKRAATEGMRARLEAQRGEMDRALDHATRAHEMATRVGSDTLIGVSLFTLHRQYVSRGQIERAELTCERALRAMARAGHVVGEIMVLASSGYLDGMLGRTRRGKARMHRALRLSKANSYAFGVMNCEYLVGVLDLTQQNWEDAIGHLRRARLIHIEHGFVQNQHQCEAVLSIALAARGELERARALHAGALAHFAEQPDPMLHYLIDVAGFAPRIWEAGWRDHDMEALDAIERELEALPRPNDAPRGLDLNIMLGFIASARQANTSEAEPSSRALRIARDASSFTAPDADAPVNMSRRRTVRRVLQALLDERLDRPGEVLDAQTLMERGWPGDSTEVRNGLMKLYVTINTLRRLGLEGILQTYGEGYRLDPDVPLTLEAEGS
jgi:tetratricopeptide (TPR) repeat protein